MESEKRIFLGISLLFFLDSICAGMIFPFLPKLFLNNKLGLIINSPINQVFFYSLSLAIYDIMTTFGMPIFGVISDKYSNKSALLIGVSLLTINYLFSAITIVERSLWLFLLSRAFGGFFCGVYSSAYSLISKTATNSPTQNTSFSGFKLIFIANKSGLIIGPILSILFLKDAYINKFAIPFLFASGFGALSLIIISHLYSSRIIDQREASESPDKIKISNMLLKPFKVFSNKKIRYLSASYFAFQCATSLFVFGVPLFLTLRLNFTIKQLGYFSIYINSIILISLFCISKIFGDGFNNVNYIKKTLYIIIFISAAPILAMELPNPLIHSQLTKTIIYCSIISIFIPICKLLFTDIFSDNTTMKDSGQIMGAYGQTSSLAYFISGIVISHVIIYHLVLPAFLILSSISLSCIFKHLQLTKSVKN